VFYAAISGHQEIWTCADDHKGLACAAPTNSCLIAEAGLFGPRMGIARLPAPK
jgi:hypothetical protein